MKYHSRYLSDSDFSSLLRFVECCEDSDADGHDVPKEHMRRLCELGVVRSIGFGRHEATSFGFYVIGNAYSQEEKLPLKTYEEINEEHRIAVEKTIGKPK